MAALVIDVFVEVTPEIVKMGTSGEVVKLDASVGVLDEASDIELDGKVVELDGSVGVPGEASDVELDCAFWDIAARAMDEVLRNCVAVLGPFPLFSSTSRKTVAVTDLIMALLQQD